MAARFITSALLALCCTAHAQDWTVDNGASRLTVDGPDLSRYATSIVGVSECKLDVAFNVRDPAQREAWKKRCYDLYPAEVRQRMYESDTKPVRFNREQVEILIRVERRDRR